MEYHLKSDINPARPQIMHIDMNSCFASVEQQYNPALRNKPIAIAPYITDYGTIISPSIEAKKLGIKTVMKIIDAKKIYPNIVLLQPDIKKYTDAHKKLRNILDEYSPEVLPKSIDEFVVNFNVIAGGIKDHTTLANEIKSKIKSRLGEWIQVSIGFGTNRFLAKTAAGLIKPNGLVILSKDNYEDLLSSLKLTDFCGISRGNSLRLNSIGIYTTKAFYTAPFESLKSVMGEVGAFQWYMKLRGWEVENFETNRGSFSHSYVLKEQIFSIESAKPILHKLCVKLGERLRQAGCTCHGIYVGVKGRDKTKFYNHINFKSKEIFGTDQLYKEACKLLNPYNSSTRITLLEVGCYHLKELEHIQLDFFKDVQKDEKFWGTIDAINSKWGRHTIIPSHMLDIPDAAPDRISFGKAVMEDK